MSDHKWMDENTRALLKEPMRASKILLYVILIFIICFIVWSSITVIDERARAQGKVITISRIQEIQNLEGGILEKIYVKEGDEVFPDQELLKIDDTQYASSFGQKQVRYFGLWAKQSRLKAESDDSELIFPAVLVENYPEFVTREAKLFRSNKMRLNSKLMTLEKNLAIEKERLALAETMINDKVISRTEYLNMKKEVNDLMGKMDAEKKDYQSEVDDQLVKTTAEMDSLNKEISGYEDTVTRSRILSTVHGIVKKINISSPGAVIAPGESILEIIPLGENLQIEARINPKDIAFIRQGQKATISITAYDPSIYGYLKGDVSYVSPDAIVDTNDKGEMETYYKVIIKSEHNYIEYKDKQLAIIPGMQTQVSILTGRKSIMQYLLKPLLKAKQDALRER